MHNRMIVTAAALIVPAMAAAQHGGTAPRIAAPPAEARQYDFLIGQWELTVTPKASGLAQRIHGAPKFGGTWKAWRAFDGWGIEDELRIVDGSGNPASFTHAMRFYDATAKSWTQTQLDVYRGRFTPSTAVWDGKAMTATTPATDPDGKPVLMRSRFHSVTPTSFRWQQDRSTDNGRTWDEGVLRIDGKRTATTASR